MTAPMMPQDDRGRIRRNVQKMAAQGASESEIETYLQSEGLRAQGESTAVPRESLKLDVRQPSESTGALSPFRENRSGDFEAVGSTAAALPLVAAQAIPGMERFEAAAGVLGSKFTNHPLSYRESLDALRSQTDPIPAPIKMAAQAPAILKTAGMMALSPAKAGAAIGAADQALSADPMSIEQRLARTAIGGTAGGAAGKTLESVLTAGRAFRAPKVEANILGRQKVMQAADAVNYGRAADEGTAAARAAIGPNDVAGEIPAVAAALKQPDIAPFADMVRASRQFVNADDATVLRETYKLMSKQQTGLARQLKEQGFDAAKQLQHDNIGAAKDELLAAADQVMPSFRQAVQAHAKGMQSMEAVDLGKKAATRLISKTSSAKPATQSAEAIRRRIQKMSPEDQQAAVQGVLGRLRETIGVQPNAVSMGGLLTTAIRPARVAPYLRSMGDETTLWLDELVRAGLLGGAVAAP